MKKALFLVFFVILSPNLFAEGTPSYEMAGEATETSIILQSRLTHQQPKNWQARFEVSEKQNFSSLRTSTQFQTALPERDFVVKEKIDYLDPGKTYFYRAVWSKTRELKSETHSFKTLSGKNKNEEIHFVAVACMNYDYFKRGRLRHHFNYVNPEFQLGYSAFAAISNLNPDFLVGLGDNVYYDPLFSFPSSTPSQMRFKWHEQFGQPRAVELFSKTPAYWMMDDHDFRFDNADPETAKKNPSAELGIKIFTEELPVLAPDAEKVFYRTYRPNSALQIWILDNRTLRSANHSVDGPEKSIWGKKQFNWLKETLMASDAPFKIIFSSTPIIGPDKLPTEDNHTRGFRYERDTFLNWLKENHFDQKNLYFVVGDSHWKYHSKDPSGFEEFGTGSLDESNAIRPAKSGSKKSTDPKGEIKQLYLDQKRMGGFLEVTATPQKLNFSLRDSAGKELYSAERSS